MNSKQRRKEYRRLIRKYGKVYYTLKVDDECVGIFEHSKFWSPHFLFCDPGGEISSPRRRRYRSDIVSKAEYETFIAFEFPVIEKTTLFGPIRVTIPVDFPKSS